MNFGEMKALVSRRLAEVNGRTFWTDPDIADAINAGYMELSDQTEWNENRVTIDLLNDRPYYDLRTIIGDRFLAVRPAYHTETRRWLIPTVARNLDVHDRRWERVTGAPQRFLLRGLWWLGLYPRTTADAGTVTLYDVELPEPLVNDDDEPGFPAAFHVGIVDFAVSDLFSQDGEATWALAAWQAYLATEAALAAWVDHRGSTPAVHGLGWGVA
jgi:hypothetical protein